MLATNAEETLSNNHFDVIVLAVKSYDTPACIAQLAQATNLMSPILCFQNGVDNETLLTKAFGAERVIAATLTTAVSVVRPGEVQVERTRGIGIDAGHSLSNVLHKSLTTAGFSTRLYSNPVAMKWSKLLANVMANATCAICDLPPLAAFQHDGLYRVEIASLRETLAVMKRLNIPAINLPKTPARTLAFAIRYLPQSMYRGFLTKKVAIGRGDKMPSLHVDLASGRRYSEVAYLNGAVARHASSLGVQTPVNQGLSDTLTAITDGTLAWQGYRQYPQRLAEELQC